jgi:hypothetical protein
MKYKPEPWAVDDDLQILDDKGDVLAQMLSRFSALSAADQKRSNLANANRLVMCVNGCYGVPSRSIRKVIRLGLQKLKKDF